MKQMIMVIFSLSYFIILPLNAQIHVGNGGGEAENIVLQMSLGAPHWAKACNENPGVCGNFKFSPSDIQALSRKISFAPLKAIKNPCISNDVIISHESLYVDLVKPKQSSELSEVLIKNLLICHGHSRADLAVLRFSLDPRMKAITNYSLALFSGTKGDIITSVESNFPVQNALSASLRCSSFRIINEAKESLSVLCLENQYQFLVYIRKSGANYNFITRLDSGE